LLGSVRRRNEFAIRGRRRVFAEARLLVLYRRPATFDLTESSEFRDLRFATIATSDAVAPVAGTRREKRVFKKIIVD